MSDTIPDAAVEAAARATFERSGDMSWDDALEWVRDICREDESVPLAAAAPFIAAQALRDAADEWQINGWADALPHGSDRPSIIIGMAQRSADWLRARADRIEASNG